METIQVIPMVRRELNRKHMSGSGLARKLNLNQASVHGMLKRPTLHVHRLLEISEILQYNFFREIAEKLPYTEPVQTEPNNNEQARERIRELEMEVRILRQTLKDAISR